jgi:hypothetical protein
MGEEELYEPFIYLYDTDDAGRWCVAPVMVRVIFKHL